MGDENILFTSKYSFSPDHYLKVRLKCIIDYVLHGNFPKNSFGGFIYESIKTSSKISLGRGSR